MERAEFEAKTKYQQKIESLEKENSILHRKLDTLHEENSRRQMDLEVVLYYFYLDQYRSVIHIFYVWDPHTWLACRYTKQWACFSIYVEIKLKLNHCVN